MAKSSKAWAGGNKPIEFVSVLTFEADPTGAADSSAAFQAAANAHKRIYIPAGNYTCDTPVALTEGQVAIGDSISAVSVTNNTGGPVFTCDLTTGDRVCPEIHGMTLIGDQCIRFGDKTVLVADDGGAAQAALTRGAITHCRFQALNDNSGNGVELTKVFSMEMHSNIFVGFTRGLLLFGSDLNNIHTNRFTGNYLYSLEEQSVGTFCSSNDIHHNEFFVAAANDHIYFKSSAIHVLFRNNYQEENSTASDLVMVECSAVNQTAYGVNALPTNVCFTMNLLNNRQEPRTAFTSYEYRIVEDFQTLNLQGVGTSGEASANGSTFIDSTGTPIDTLPSLFSTGPRQTQININQVESFGSWNSYDGKTVTEVGGASSVVVTSAMFEAALAKNQTRDNLRIGSDYWEIIDANSADLAWIRLDCDQTRSEAENLFYVTGQAHAITLYMRSTVAGDTCVAAMGGDAFGEANQTFTLTDQYEPYTWQGNGAADTITNLGVHVALGTGSTGKLQIKAFSVEPIYMVATAAELGDAGNRINTVGKLAGKYVRNTTDEKPYWAESSTTTARWLDATGAGAITPS
jgi:hypothetical protein